ncbi:MAG: Smr/MutS family protein [Xanthomonadaceae bacterium]|nr:Smr/MutS family protein [Silanimonas sp.]MBS3924574.1 Smr/MutS family protein [Xanthomonadaceae bacterium]
MKMPRPPRRPPPARAAPAAPDDAALFREAIGPVRVIAVEPAAIEAHKPQPNTRRHDEDEAEALRESLRQPLDALAYAMGEVLEYRRDELPMAALKRLKRGEFAVQDELDLHRMRVDEAEAALRIFLGEARRNQFPCVRLVHGKGLRSEFGPVLKALVDRVLRHRGDVLAFCSAPAAQGGTGATLVLLRGP